MNQKGFAPIIIIAIITIALAVGYFAWRAQPPSDTGKACTQEAKLCPDGSYVGRTGPNCEFAPCPSEALCEGGPCPKPPPLPEPVYCAQDVKLCPDGSYVGRMPPTCEFKACPSPIPPPKPEPGPGPSEIEVTLREGQREGSLLVEKIYPDRIEGLNFPAYPVGVGRGLPITLRIGETASNGCTITLTLIHTQGNTATFIKKTDYTRNCPICLAQGTLIDTPFGKIPVEKLKKGMSIWTMNASGKRAAGIILETAKTSAPATHNVAHLVLDDGRELFVSSGHPTADGKPIGELQKGNVLDGARVISIRYIPYRYSYTYDVLPSGETGFYWANEILMGSTLSPQ